MKRILKTLAVPLVLFIGWWVILGILLAKTANQPNVSEPQLGIATRVIVGTATATPHELKAKAGEVETTILSVVVKVEGIALDDPDAAPAELNVTLPETVEFYYPDDQSLPPDRILVPLEFRNDRWMPALAPLGPGGRGGQRMFVYPDSESVRERCREIWTQQSLDKSQSDIQNQTSDP